MADQNKPKANPAPSGDRNETGGESAGGAYPRGERKADAEGFMGHGGQSEMAYHGKGRLGGKELEGNRNAPAETENQD